MPAREGSHRVPQALPGLETISPELALVDPVLADAARGRLPDAPGPPPVPSPTPPSWRRHSYVRLAAAAAISLALLAVAAAQLQTGERETGAPAGAAQLVASRGQTFTWAASAGAAAYEFQLFRGAERVHRTRAVEPRLQLPAATALSPGRYHWYVWPVPQGAVRPAGAAIVSATLTIGGDSR